MGVGVGRDAGGGVRTVVGTSEPNGYALAALREGQVGDSHERNALKALVDALDERAWDIQDEVEAGRAAEQQYLDGFALARAASAVWFALDADPLTAALEATYEAQAARGDLEGARRRILDAVA